MALPREFLKGAAASYLTGIIGSAEAEDLLDEVHTIELKSRDQHLVLTFDLGKPLPNDDVVDATIVDDTRP